MNICRTTALTARHADLGADFQEYIRMAMPMKYRTSLSVEHNAVREHAGLYDLTAFLKFFVRGKDAIATVSHSMAVDISKLKIGQAKYGPFLREDGTICDDGIAFKLSEEELLVVHGDGCARTMTEESAKGRDVEVIFDDALHVISLQGPTSIDTLAPHTPADLRSLKYFQITEKTELFGIPCRIARCGYSGERGYEIYAYPHEIIALWDKVLEAGKEFGVIPCSLSAIFPTRLEAGLVWRRFDLMEQTPWEAGLGWAFGTIKDIDFRGKEGVIASKGKERVKLCGLVVDIDTALAGGETLSVNGKDAGTVNGAPAYSPRLQKSLAWAKVKPEFSDIGTVVEVKRADGTTCSATVTQFPVYDPKGLRTRAV